MSENDERDPVGTESGLRTLTIAEIELLRDSARNDAISGKFDRLPKAVERIIAQRLAAAVPAPAPESGLRAAIEALIASCQGSTADDADGDVRQ